MDKELRKEYFDKAFKLHNMGQINEAKVFYKKITEENPEDSEVLNLIGLCELQQKNYEEAQKYVIKAIQIRPNRYFYESLAEIFHVQNKYREELEVLKNEEKVFGLNYDLSFRMGLCFKNNNNFEKAKFYYEKALEFNPNSRDAILNIAIVYLRLKEIENAQQCYQKCLDLNPNDREAEYFLGLCYFRLKNYEKGLKHFEVRLCRESAIETTKFNYPNLTKKARLWQGEDISDKTLYTYYEAGFGDMIMFARYIPLLLKRCKKLILKPQVPLSQLFRENFPQVEVMDCFYREEQFDFDYHIPFLSIPYVLGLSTDDMFIFRDRYLKADENKVLEFKNRFFNNDKFKIAIKWRGNTYYETDRVINIEAFGKLFDLPNVQVYNAQTFEGHEEIDKLSRKYDIIDLSESFKDFSYTAAAMENIDMVICNDTSLAHLAAAMHKPCSMLLPYNTNWRWHTDLSYCDWYETLKLYPANLNENWSDVMDRVIADIKKLSHK